MLPALRAAPGKYRILGWLGAILLAGFLSISVASYLVSRDSIRNGIAEQALPLTADNIYSEIQKDLLRPVFISSLMAQDTFVRDWILGGERDTSRIARYLNEVREKYGTVISFLATERSRNYYYQGGVLRQIRPGNDMDKWFFRVRDMKEPFETNVDPDEINQHAMTIYINYRVLDYQGHFIGATGVGLTLDSVGRLVDRYEDQFRRRIYFVSPQGNIVLAGKSMKGMRGSIRSLPGISTIAEQILHGNGQPARLTYQGPKFLVLVNSRFIPELGWYLVVEEDEGEELRGVQRVFALNLAISAAVSVLVLATMWLVVRRYQGRIEALAQEALTHAAKEMEQAHEQQEFVAMVSHEFRTPLAIIDTALQSLKRQEDHLPEDITLRHHKIHRASRRLQELIGNYLTGDRLKQASYEPEREAVNLPELLTRIVRRAEWPGMALDWDGREITVRGDRELLHIVFFNLVNNAMKYSPEGGPVRIGCVAADGYATVSVADSGSGIAPEELPHIFDKYYRAPGNQASGAGLGLYLVKRIVELHGGTAAAESLPGQGTTLTIRLPLE